MSDIKIFVSHRIDINSEMIDNPLYVPVRCGAVFDKENPMDIAGDDTGDSISEKRMSFCEFTVQYWAWKNIRADFYGLCHYRRYLSFAERRFRANEYNMVHNAVLTPGCKRKFSLTDPVRMTEQICSYDAVVSEYAPVADIPTPGGKKRTVRELWEAHDGVFFEKSSIDLLFELISRMAPEYAASAQAYFAGGLHRGFNCFVLRKELFDRLCSLQFPIMFEIERRLDTTGYTQTMLRTPAFIGEMLYGIFMYHISTREDWRVKEVQLAFFSDTEKIQSRAALYRKLLWYGVDRVLRAVADPIMPKGTRRRERVKDLFYAITPAKRHGVAEIKR